MHLPRLNNNNAAADINRDRRTLFNHECDNDHRQKSQRSFFYNNIKNKSK